MTPCGKRYIENQGKKVQDEINGKWKARRKNQVYKLPDKAWKEETILNRMRAGDELQKQYYTNGGKVTGTVYNNNEEHWDFISEVMRLQIQSNPLHFVEFQYVV